MSESRYPIGAVAVLTGLTVDTLRAWERRHQVVTPSRDERGRVYGDADVRRLQLVAAAVSRGHAVGRLARLDDAALTALLETPNPIFGAALPADPATAPRRPRRGGIVQEPAAGLGAPLGRVLAALRRFDASEVEREIGRVAAALPPRDLVHAWVLPLMRHTGVEWHDGRLSTGAGAPAVGGAAQPARRRHPGHAARAEAAEPADDDAAARPARVRHPRGGAAGGARRRPRDLSRRRAAGGRGGRRGPSQRRLRRRARPDLHRDAGPRRRRHRSHRAPAPRRHRALARRRPRGGARRVCAGGAGLPAT